MWPICFPLNKALKLEEERVSDIKHSNSVDLYLHDQPSSNSKCSHTVLPSSHFIVVPHINQLYSWDCGLACVLMVLRTLGINSCNIQSLVEQCSTTWTSCLAIWYEWTGYFKGHVKLELIYRSINREEISHLILSGKYIVIALVDQHKLSRTWLEDVFVKDLSGNSGYTGHFIVICGYDSCTDEFEIRDPASSREQEKVSSECLEEARKSFGTDEDLLLISLEENTKQQIN